MFACSKIATPLMCIADASTGKTTNLLGLTGPFVRSAASVPCSQDRGGFCSASRDEWKSELDLSGIALLRGKQNSACIKRSTRNAC